MWLFHLFGSGIPDGVIDVLFAETSEKLLLAAGFTKLSEREVCSPYELRTVFGCVKLDTRVARSQRELAHARCVPCKINRRTPVVVPCPIGLQVADSNPSRCVGWCQSQTRLSLT